MQRLLSISAFYRNDEPNGIGITLRDEAGDLTEIFQLLKDSYDAMWEESENDNETDTLTADLFEQLQAIGQSKPITDPKKMLLVIGNVYLLERVGALITDEFNGLQFAYLNL